jgi:hypothetical protein
VDLVLWSRSWTLCEGETRRGGCPGSGGQVFRKGNHTLTLFGIGYYGFSYVAGLSPIHGFNSVDAANGWTQYPDTVDSRQKDQTHAALIALNDVWKLGENQELQLSGFFRTIRRQVVGHQVTAHLDELGDQLAVVARDARRKVLGSFDTAGRRLNRIAGNGDWRARTTWVCV